MKPELQTTHTQLENPAEPIELGLLLDRSGSMNPLAPTTVAAFNTLLKQQRELNAAATRVSLLLFNESCETVCDGYPLATISDLAPSAYQPSGSTAQWDGLGTMIEPSEPSRQRADRTRLDRYNNRWRGECFPPL